MRFTVITLFPEEFQVLVSFGVLGRAINKKTIGLNVINPRTFTEDIHHTIDDRPFGGGDGMVMKLGPLSKAVAAARLQDSENEKSVVIHLSPQGKPLTSELASRLASKHDHVILISSRYAGVDQRFITSDVDYEVTIGDYILSGGEFPAAVLMDVVSRFVPGVLGGVNSAQNESFGKNGWLEAPQFTRPESFDGIQVPAILMSGHHENINKWRDLVSMISTLAKRPDLFSSDQRQGFKLAQEMWPKAKQFIQKTTESEYQVIGLDFEKAELIKRGDSLFLKGIQ